MIPTRVIARLDVKGPNVVKGVHLEGLRVVGQPGELARRYYEDGADEILFMDVVASLYGRNNLDDIVKRAASEIFIPLTVGGGIRTVEDAVRILHAGADKIAVNTAAVARPAFLTELAHAFGSQCVVLSVEAKRRPQGWEVLTDNGRETTGKDVVAWIREAQSLGVGEVLVTSVDREGTRKGFDIELMKAVRSEVNVPLMACGGAWGGDTVTDLFAAAQAEAVVCASTLHYKHCGVADIKAAVARAGLPVRK